jgi:hypothetical protein
MSSNQIHGLSVSNSRAGAAFVYISSILKSAIKPGELVDQVKDGEHKEGKTNEAEAKNLSTTEGSEETSSEILDFLSFGL